MNTAFLIPNNHDLIEAVASRLIKDGKDYTSNLVVFPGKRPSHFLRRAIAQKEQGAVIPPAIFSMDEFVDYVYAEKLGVINRKIDVIDAISILYEIHKKSSKPIGGDDFINPDEFFSIGLKIYHDIEELYIENIDKGQVRNIEPLIEGGVPKKTKERLHSLSYYYDEFYKKIESLNLSTRSLRYHFISKEISKSGLEHYKQIIIAGFFALTASEKIIFKNLFNIGNASFIFQDGTGISEKINNSDLGFRVTQPMDGSSDLVKDNNRELPAIHYYQSPDTHGQVLGINSIIADKLKEGNVDEKTVFVLPSSETLFPLIHHTLSVLSEDDYNISMGYPLHRTPIFGFLNNLMQSINSMEGEHFYIPDYLNLILHPYVKNILFNGRADITRIMFHTIEEELIEKKTVTFATLSEIEGNEEIFNNILKKIEKNEAKVTKEDIKTHLNTIHRNIIERYIGFKNVGNFAQKGIEVLTYIYENSTARYHPLFYPYFEAFIESFNAISNSLMKDTILDKTVSYFNLFKKYIMTCHVPFKGTPIKGLQVLGFLETRNLKFDNVFILDMNEDIIPATGKNDSILPFKARKALNLPTYADSDKIAAYYFDTLIRGAKEIHLYFTENDKKEKSRFVEQLIWERQKKSKGMQSSNYIKSIAYSVELKNETPASINKTEDILKYLRDYSFSPTSLNTYLKCQLQFYYKYVLKIGEKKDISDEIENVDIGKFVHKVLLNLFNDKKGRNLTEKDFRKEEIDNIVERLFEQDYGKNPIGANYLLQLQIKNRLQDFLQDYQIPLIKKIPVKILNLEERIVREVEISNVRFKLEGNLDRIEKRDEQIFILDYKISSNKNYLKIRFDKLDPNNRETWIKAIGSIQLPFYLYLYSESEKVNIEKINCCFLLLGKTNINEEIELPLFKTDEDVKRSYDTIKDIIFKLLQEITDSKIPFNPASDIKNVCPDCEFKNICGTQWLSKKKWN